MANKAYELVVFKKGPAIHLIPSSKALLAIPVLLVTINAGFTCSKILMATSKSFPMSTEGNQGIRRGLLLKNSTYLVQPSSYSLVSFGTHRERF